jgi:uncharacterized membrane protein
MAGMRTTLLQTMVGGLGYAMLDALWLGAVMTSFYREQLRPIARMADGGLSPHWPAAAAVYLLLGAGVALLAVPRATTLPTAFAAGAMFGAIVYGVYDFTNYATLRQWPFAVVLVDVAWGTFAGALCTAAAWAVSR